MDVVVLSLTRDRADYTRHCFQSLRENAGVRYDHLILDQASDDHTPDVLEEYMRVRADDSPWMKTDVTFGDENVGIHKGWNLLLDFAGDDYDVYVTFDNDCEVFMPGTLAACAQAVETGEWIVTPTVNGLKSPLTPGAPQDANGVRVGETPIIGGICRAIPGGFIRDGFRFNADQALWGGDENWIAHCFPGRVGWLLDWAVNHYKTTEGQEAEQPIYFARKFREMGLV